MPRMFDAAEGREVLTARIRQLLMTYGSGNADEDEAGWTVESPSSDTLLIHNLDDLTLPRFLVSVEVSNT